MNTFSVNSLKILDKNPEEFINKYILHLDFLNKNNSANKGERLHAMISYYLKGYDISKIKNSMSEDERQILDNILSTEIFSQKEKFIKTEESFLVKLSKSALCERDFYLTGRFDAIFKDNENYTIYDWKTKTIPQNPQDELQSIVYLYCASKIFNTENIDIKYISLEKNISVQTKFDSENTYYERICKIVGKLPKNI